jgi:AraC family transcriptional regulator
MPDLPPRPQTPRNAAFRREFYRRWGRENCIVSGLTHRAEYPLFRQTLSLKCVARGTETYFVDRRQVTVSDDTFLVLNEGRAYASVLDAPTEAYSFSIFFRPGMAREVAGDIHRSMDQVLDDGAQVRSTPMEFDETLRAHDSAITPVLRYLQREIAAGLRDEQWLEEQCQFLLARLIRSQHRQGKGSNLQLDAGSAGKRVEVARRLQRAVDYMHTHLPDEITLADIATVAHLSKFHFLRLFQQAHGRTPMVYLRELRARRALALVASTSLSSAEIALRVGLSRSAMWRRLCHVKGAGARVLRRLDAGSPVGFLASS